MDNRIRFPPTKIDFDDDVGVTGQEHDDYPAPGQPRFDWMRMYLIGLLSHQSGTIEPSERRVGTFWVDTNEDPAVIKMFDGVSWVDLSTSIYVEEDLTLQEWYDAASAGGSLELPIPAVSVTFDETGTGLSSETVQAAIAELAAWTLNDLTDVNAGAPSDGQVLTWDDATSRWVAADTGTGGGGGGSTTLAGLTDVEINTPVSTQLLTFTGVEWENTNFSTYDVGDLGNVDTSGISNTVNILRYNGVSGNFEMIDVAELLSNAVIDNIGNVNGSAPITGEVLIYNGTNWDADSLIDDLIVTEDRTWSSSQIDAMFGVTSPSTTGMRVLTTHDTSIPHGAASYDDHTEEAESGSSSTFLVFKLSTLYGSGQALYIGADEPFTGIKCDIVTAAGWDRDFIEKFQWQYYSIADGGFKEMMHMNHDESETYGRYSFARTTGTDGLTEYVQFEDMHADWEKQTINGEHKYWVRFHHTSSIGVDVTRPELESISLMYDRTHIEPLNGVLQYWGDAQPEFPIVSKAWEIAATAANTDSHTLAPTTNIDFTIWNPIHSFASGGMPMPDSTIAQFGWTFTVPQILDVSKDITARIAYNYISGVGDGDVELELYWCSVRANQNAVSGSLTEQSDLNIISIVNADAGQTKFAEFSFNLDLDVMKDELIMFSLKTKCSGI